MINMSDAISYLQKQVPNPSQGLPDEVFYYISSTTPLINVDLMIKDECGRILLSWRDDQYSGKGWHIPGGIIRFKETIEERIYQVSINEVGCVVEYDPVPLTVKQVIHKDRNKRAHFISLLFNCRLPGCYQPDNHGLTLEDPGYLMWHYGVPEQFLACHNIYRQYL